MTDAALELGSLLTWGVSASALEAGVSGDLHLIAPSARGAVVAVVDGLGHGPEAALAAEAAAEILRDHAEAPVEELLQRCHEGMHKTRGAALTLASIDARTSSMDWGGVGNVEAVLLRARPAPTRSHEAAPTRGGVVGFRLPPLKVNHLTLYSGDVLVFASDGIRSGFTQHLDCECEPQALAELIFTRHAKRTDDALVLVARYLGGLP